MEETPDTIAIIGGTGFRLQAGVATPAGREGGTFEDVTVRTRWGEALLTRTRARQAGREVVFLDRHRAPEPGADRVPPHRIDYRANMAALASVGATGVLASNAVGSLRREWAPGTLVLPDQILDRTSGRPLTFFDHRPVHVDFTEPYCSRLRELLRGTALDMGIDLVDGGTYVCTNGPRFETAAEVRAYRSLGADLVGMTAMPEAVLAREAGISYAAVAVVTNPAAGTAEGALTEGEVLDAMSGAMPRLARLFHEAAGRYRDDPSAPARRAAAEFGSPDVT